MIHTTSSIHGEPKDSLRAVKKIRKLALVEYYRELEAIALFSHDQASRLLVYALSIGHISGRG